MKKIIKLMVLTISVFVFGNISAFISPKHIAAEQTQKLKVGYVAYTLNDPYQNYLINAATDEAEQLGITLELVNAEEDLIRQQDHVHTLIENGIDALIVVPYDTSAMGPITESAVEAGIPLVYLNRNPFSTIDEMPEDVYYVGSDEVIAGNLQARETGRLLNGQGNVAIILGQLGVENTILRTHGVKSYFEEHYPEIKIISEETSLEQRDQAVSLTENLISAHGKDLHAILANNDEAALGAVQALKNSDREDVIVMGIDLIPDAIEAIESGTMTGSIFQDADGQGRGSVQKIFSALNNESIESPVSYIDFQLVTIENLAEFK